MFFSEIWFDKKNRFKSLESIFLFASINVNVQITFIFIELNWRKKQSFWCLRWTLCIVLSFISDDFHCHKTRKVKNLLETPPLLLIFFTLLVHYWIPENNSGSHIWNQVFKCSYLVSRLICCFFSCFCSFIHSCVHNQKSTFIISICLYFFPVCLFVSRKKIITQKFL